LFAQVCEGNTSATANTDIATVVSGTAAIANFVRGRLVFREARAALYTRPARLRVNPIVFFIDVLSQSGFSCGYENEDSCGFCGVDVESPWHLFSPSVQRLIRIV
jgi:hypothetical protein